VEASKTVIINFVYWKTKEGTSNCIYIDVMYLSISLCIYDFSLVLTVIHQ